eukprot:SAG31_NODE_190_length_20810_cov_20.296364_5_plen_58_part_00
MYEYNIGTSMGSTVVLAWDEVLFHQLPVYITSAVANERQTVVHQWTYRPPWLPRAPS